MTWNSGGSPCSFTLVQRPLPSLNPNKAGGSHLPLVPPHTVSTCHKAYIILKIRQDKKG